LAERLTIQEARFDRIRQAIKVTSALLYQHRMRRQIVEVSPSDIDAMKSFSTIPAGWSLAGQ
jgi:hypothetical protein